ncbi:MAG: restriction endonuclease [Ignisphaera sp.]
MNYIDIYDLIEQLLKHHNISKHIISLVDVKDKDKLRLLIDWCIDKKIIEEDDDNIRLLRPVEFLISLSNFGIQPDRFSVYIEWNEFEQYVSWLLAELGWDVYANYLHTRADRFQIDVIALNELLKLTLFVECKHWKKLSRVRLDIGKVVEKHIKRVEKYLRNCEWVCIKITKLRNAEHILPVIIILFDSPIKVLNGVPIVPIYKVIDFVINIDSYIDTLNLVLYKNRCYIGS